jgi:hypothetical protein
MPGKAFGLALTVFLWLGLISLPAYVWGATLDDSWEQGLGILLTRGAKAGVDYIFTFGPLGYCFTGAYEPGLFWWKYAWELVIKLAMAIVFGRLARDMRPSSAIAFAVGLVLFFGPALRSQRDGLYGVFQFALMLWFLRATRPWWQLTAGAMLLAGLSLVKFSLLVPAVGYILILTSDAAGRRNWRQAIAWPVLFVSAWLLGWLAVGQSWSNLGAYFRGSWEIARGFGEAMSLPGPSGEQLLGLVALTALLMALAAGAVPRAPLLIPIALVSVIMFLAWTQGFTRQDLSHTLAYFSQMVFSAWMLLGTSARLPIRRLGRVALWVTLVSSAVGIGMWKGKERLLGLLQFNGQAYVATARDVLSPLALKHRLDMMRLSPPAELALPRIRARVGGQRVDLLSYIQGVLFANELNWSPRPVFQSYSVYTPYLLRANADYFRSSKAPEFVVVALMPLDVRMPTLEDGEALLAILERYEPLLVETLNQGPRPVHCLLMGRLQEPREPQPRMTTTRTIRFAEELRLLGNEDLTVLSVKFRPTLGGRLFGYLYHPPPMWITLTTSDGRKWKYRFVPSMGETAWLISPLVTETRTLLTCYGVGKPVHVESLRFETAESGWNANEDMIEVTISSWPRPVLSPDSSKQILER